MKKLLLVFVLTLSFVLKSNAQIGITQPSDYEICGSNGFADFDLSIKDAEILNGLDPLNYSITYHLTLLEASDGINALISPFTNVSNPQTIFVRVFELSTGNFEVTNFNLIVSSVINLDLGLDDVSLCAGETLVFDTGLDNAAYSFSWYLDGQLITGEVQSTLSINQVGSYSVEVSDSSTGCISVDSGLVTDFETAISSPSPLVVCDEDADGFALFDLSLRDLEITNGQSNVIVTYHETQSDADTNVNAISSPYANIIQFNQVIYVRVENANGDCATILELDIEASASLCQEDVNIIVDTTAYSVYELVQDVFIGNNCSSIFNITFSTGTSFNNNEPNGIGYFSYAGSNFPFNEGLVLSTGNVKDAEGPNTSDNVSSGSGVWPGDADLNNTLGINSNNATVIEFDFVPVVSQINFEFLMASEEYDMGSFECSFSDAFAFLLTDEQGNTTNLAVLPGTNTPILITNIHPDNGSCAAANPEFFGGYIPTDEPPISYNGRTVPFTAQADVNVGENYHIKLVIADAGDSLFDSAVFLRAGSFDIGELCNDVGLINTKAFVDENSNGFLDPDESDFVQGYFTYEKNNDGIINQVNTNLGNFSIVSTNETDTYDITFNIYDEYTNCYVPITSSVENMSVANGEVVTIDFPIENNQSCQDLAVYLVNPFDAPRPGFDYLNQLIIENVGNSDIASGTIEVVLDEQLNYNGIIQPNPGYTVTTTDSGFTLDFVNLEVGETEVVHISLNCDVTAQLDDIVTNTATYVTVSSDIEDSNNQSSLSEIVIGSYDPNDIFESHGPEIVYDDFVVSDEWLYYTIRFQNLGTAEAIFVRIEDDIDLQLDESTFQMLRSSHDYTVTRTGSSLEWYFEDIDLPAEQDDEPGSHGFVHFKIKPKSGYEVGDIIPNSAAIYFDFNPPVITNTFNTQFVEPLSVNEFNNSNYSVYPNPAKDRVTVSARNNTVLELQIELVDLQGKRIQLQQIINDNTVELNVTSLKSGVYFIKLNDGQKVSINKLIIE